VARRRLLGYPAPLDTGFWYRPKHAAPSLLIRVARRMGLAQEFAQPRRNSQRSAIVRPQWPRLTVVGIEATPVRRAA